MRAAVIGVGHLGQHHARILASLPGVSLAGVVDINTERAAKIAGELRHRGVRRRARDQRRSMSR